MLIEDLEEPITASTLKARKKHQRYTRNWLFLRQLGMEIKVDPDGWRHDVSISNWRTVKENTYSREMIIEASPGFLWRLINIRIYKRIPISSDRNILIRHFEGYFWFEEE